MALLDVLKNTMSVKKAQNTVGPAAGDIQNLIQTKQTGKAQGPAGGPATSNIAGQVQAQADATTAQSQAFGMNLAAGQQAQQAADQQAQLDQQAAAQAQNTATNRANILAQESMAGQQRNAAAESAQRRLTAGADAQTLELNNKYANAVQTLASERGISENEIFQNFQQETAKLGLEKSAAMLEQLGHTLAMSDQRYVDTLKQIGAENNLIDDIAFKREANTLAFQKDLEILSQQFDMERLINADERTFQREMAQLDINTALSMAAQAAREASATQMINGTVNMGTAYMKNQDNVNSWFAGIGNDPATAPTSTPTSGYTPTMSASDAGSIA